MFQVRNRKQPLKEASQTYLYVHYTSKLLENPSSLIKTIQMGLQLVALAKLNAVFTSQTTLTPLLAGLVWPFLVKLSFGSRLVRETYIDVVHASSLFFFQLRQIAVEAEQLPTTGAASTSASSSGGGSRWERAVRLVYRSVTRARRSMPTSVEDEDSLHALSLLAL